jgi:hypothetical protein
MCAAQYASLGSVAPGESSGKLYACEPGSEADDEPLAVAGAEGADGAVGAEPTAVGRAVGVAWPVAIAGAVAEPAGEPVGEAVGGSGSVATGEPVGGDVVGALWSACAGAGGVAQPASSAIASSNKSGATLRSSHFGTFKVICEVLCEDICERLLASDAAAADSAQPL